MPLVSSDVPIPLPRRGSSESLSFDSIYQASEAETDVLFSQSDALPANESNNMASIIEIAKRLDGQKAVDPALYEVIDAPSKIESLSNYSRFEKLDLPTVWKTVFVSGVAVSFISYFVQWTTR